MRVRIGDVKPTPGVTLTYAAADWWDDPADAIDAKEAARILDWDNPNSVRNRAREGGFRVHRRGNGRLLFHRGDVLEYAARVSSSGMAK